MSTVLTEPFVFFFFFLSEDNQSALVRRERMQESEWRKVKKYKGIGQALPAQGNTDAHTHAQTY